MAELRLLFRGACFGDVANDSTSRGANKENEKASTGKICLVNSAGQVVRMEKLEPGENKFKISHLDNLPTGTYYLCFVSQDNKVALQKVVKQ